MLLLVVFSFLSGLVTILAPCIWPLLPIVLSSSIAGSGHKRPLGIALGVTISFAFFTLAVSSLVRAFHFDPNILRLLSVIVIAILGVSMVFPSFSLILEDLVSRLSGLIKINKTQGSGFSGGFISGLSLGVIWSPCAGPILAAITTLAAAGSVSLSVILITISYSLGVGIPLFLFAYGGQKLLAKSKVISPFTGRIQQIFGVFMLLTAFAIYANIDKVVELKILNAFPVLNQSLSGFEAGSAVTNELNQLTGRVNQSTQGQAPDFKGYTKWLNTDKPLTIGDLKGKVVLVDFWTYTCINCIRTLPFTTAWYDKYKDDGFVVVGVHTPEFEFEKDTSNVEGAIKQFGIHYPVVQDNNYAIWNAYNNQYWPAEYLIDAQGHIRDTHFGEGGYDQTEQKIQELLKEAGHPMSASLSNITDQTPQQQLSPESYLGTKRMEFYYPSGSLQNGTYNLSLNDKLPVNSFTLGGSWNISDESATSGTGASLNYNFSANKVFLVISPSAGSTSDKIRVFLDGRLVDSTFSGNDVKNGEVVVDSDRLYNLIDLKGVSGEHTLKLEFENSGTQVFAFTFG